MIGTHLADFIMVGVIKTQKKPDICLQYLFTFFQEKHWRYRERPYMRDSSPQGRVYGVSAFCMAPTCYTINYS
jgi:hypothetical protein